MHTKLSRIQEGGTRNTRLSSTQGETYSHLPCLYNFPVATLGVGQPAQSEQTAVEALGSQHNQNKQRWRRRVAVAKLWP